MNVIKRNGTTVPFEEKKIENAVARAFIDTGEIDVKSIPTVASAVTMMIVTNLKESKNDTPTVEQLQDMVEATLMKFGYSTTAKSYILYREQHQKARQAKNTLLDYKKLVEGYIGENKDWRVKENSTVTLSVGALILSNSGAITANYWLSEIYDEAIAEAHKNCFIHIHDLSMLTGYCAGWNLKQLIQEGLGGVPDRISSAPAKHLSTLCNQMVNFLGIMQNEWAGAQAFSSFDTYLAPFVKAENLDYKQVKQCVQSFIYGVNTPSRWGTQAPFTNVTLDWTVPDDLKDMPAIVGGKEMDFTYGDCKKEMDMINKAFIETMIEGDANGRGFQYPIPTYSITKEFDWSETENNKLLFEMTAKYGTPYFSNYVNSDMKPSDIRSMCPLAGTEKVLVRDDFSKEFHVSTIKNLYESNKSGIYEIILNGKIKKAVINRFDNQKFYKIKTVNGHEITLSGSHANLIYGNNIKRTDELTLKDYLPFNITALEGKGLSYEDGLLVGAFMGDGSIKDDYAITYSLNETTKKDLMNEIIRIAIEKYGAKYKINKLENNCTNLVVTSRIIRGLISEYVSGKSTEKELNVKCIDKSLDFRKGILDGYMQTDGGNKLRIYSASKKAVDSLVTMLMSMGIPSRISVDDRDNTKTLSNNPVYTVKLYEENDKRNTYGDVFKKDENYMWFRIESIEEVKNGAHLGYCFQVLDDEEPYFTLPCGLVTHNCRLRLDLRELRKKGGGFFGSGESTGSVGVVTLNLPRIAYLSKSKEEFYETLDKYMDIAARSLSIKRKVITRLMDEGLYPYTKRYLGSFQNHFSTIGIVGMNEAILNAKWMPKETIATEKGHEFALEVLKHMRNRLADYQEKYVGDLYNLEATPAESTAYRFAKHDTEDYPDIITAASEGNAPYYTNSTHLPVGYTDDIFEALEMEDDMQTMYTSGTVFHGFLGERLPDWKSAATLVRKIANNFKLPYYTLSPTYSVCAEHGYITGEHFKCPKCGRDAEVYSRITGYYRPVRNWNDGKASEFVNRKTYDTEDDIKQEIAKREIPATEETPDKKLHDAAKCVAAKVDATAPKSIASNGKRFLVSTKTCPKCVFIKKQLETAGLRFTPLYAEDKEGSEMAQKYNISSVPVLIDETGSEPVLYPFEKITQYIKEHQDEK